MKPVPYHEIAKKVLGSVLASLRGVGVVDGQFRSVSCGLLSMCIVCSGKSAWCFELLCWVSKV